jgi:hypothetical protein
MLFARFITSTTICDYVKHEPESKLPATNGGIQPLFHPQLNSEQ